MHREKRSNVNIQHVRTNSYQDGSYYTYQQVGHSRTKKGFFATQTDAPKALQPFIFLFRKDLMVAITFIFSLMFFKRFI